MPTPQAMKVLSKDDKDAAMHTHFMKLAIEQANLSAPIPSGYCVGAVLVQESHPNPTSDLPQEDRFQVVTTGFSRELPGNTHAEECCLLKLEILEAEAEEKEKELELAVGAAPGGRKGSVSGSGAGAARKSSVSGAGQVSGQMKAGENATATEVLEETVSEHRKEWIMYSTMEPCSTRLSGNRSCSDRLIESGVRRVYVGVREPDHFVQKVVGVENMVEQGIEVVHIPGFEDACLAPNRHVLQ